jgi:hypothetical protein
MVPSATGLCEGIGRWPKNAGIEEEVLAVPVLSELELGELSEVNSIATRHYTDLFGFANTINRYALPICSA